MADIITYADQYKGSATGSLSRLLLGQLTGQTLLRRIDILAPSAPQVNPETGNVKLESLTQQPDVFLRFLNENFDDTAASFTPEDFGYGLFGNMIKLDHTQENKLGGRGKMSFHLEILGRSIADTIADKLINGDSSVDPRDIQGLVAHARRHEILQGNVGTNVVSVDTGGGSGGPLSYSLLQKSIREIRPATRILILSTRTMYTVLSSGARNSTITNLRDTRGDFGVPVSMFDNIELINPGKDKDGNEIMDSDNLDATQSSATTSQILIVSMAPDEGWTPFRPFSETTWSPQETDERVNIRAGFQEAMGSALQNFESVKLIEHIDETLPMID